MDEPWRGAFITSSGLGPAAWALIAVSWFLHGFHMSVVTEIALRTAASKPVKPGPLLVSASVNAIPVLLLQTVLTLIIIAGGVFLLVPGVFLGAALSVLIPVYICEGKSLPIAFRRSFELTQDRRLAVGALWFSIIFVVDLLSGNLLSAGLSLEALLHNLMPALSLPPLPSPEPPPPFLVSPLGTLLLTLVNQGYAVVLIVLNVAIYLGLRFHKSDPANNQIAAIFE